MCWVGETSIFKEQNAQEDIRVIKVLAASNDKYYSYYFWFNYEFGKVYDTKLVKFYDTKFGVKDMERLKIYEGFHSYSNLLTFRKTHTRDNNDAIQVRDYHDEQIEWYASVGRYKAVLAACTIPKGSKYWLNHRGEYVSDKIIINQIIE